MNGTDASSRSPEPPRSGFPQSPEDFDADPRISFSKLDGKFILEADDGQEYEFDDALKRWVLVVCLHSPSLCSKIEGHVAFCNLQLGKADNLF